ncbi:bacterial Ig-like domain-containing protein [Listeria costaricensis]|uniref:bacterial Ig-like domain-containing protein n=1 Tax=Listeria costaricensis TaxID=2026604 RepID=UPI000C08AB2F|nr:bacterial Ig-like domain-containing protein [Listeria costaricensis]
MKKIIYVSIILLCFIPLNVYVFADEQPDAAAESTNSETTAEQPTISETAQPNLATDEMSQAAPVQETTPSEPEEQPEEQPDDSEAGIENINDWMPDPYMQAAAMTALGVDSPDQITKIGLSTVDSLYIDARVQTLKGIEYTNQKNFFQIHFEGDLTEDFHPDFSALYIGNRVVYIFANTQLINIDSIFADVFTNMSALHLFVVNSTPMMLTEELTADNYQNFSIPISSFYTPVHYFTYEAYPGENEDFWAQHSGETVDQVPLPVEVGRYFYVDVGDQRLLYKGNVDVANEALTFQLVNQVNYEDIANLEGTSSTTFFAHGYSYGATQNLSAVSEGVTEQDIYSFNRDLQLQIHFAPEQDLTAVVAHDSTLYTGDKWEPADNFDSATDKAGNPVDFSQVSVKGTVDTTKAGTYPITYQYGTATTTINVTVKPDLTSIEAHDSTVSIGGIWNPADNLIEATDRDGKPVPFENIQVTDQVDTTKAGRYPVTYQNGSAKTTVYVTVEGMSATSGSHTGNSATGGQANQAALPQTGDSSTWPLVLLGLGCLFLYRLKK